MKTIKYIIFSMVILSMTMGNISYIMGQDKVLFSETYSSGEFTSLLDKEDQYFKLVNTSQVDPDGARLGTCAEAKADILWEHLQSEAIANLAPEDLSFAWGWNCKEGMRTLFVLRESNKHSGPDKGDIQSVTMNKGRQTGTYELLITFSDEGAKSWAVMTRENVNRNIAIVVDGKVVTAPKVMEEIKMGKCLISGNFDKKEAAEIKAILEE